MKENAKILELILKQIKHILEKLLQSYLYAILSEMDERFITRRLKNWEFYYSIYLE